MAESCKLEEVIIKAIPEIREKGHKKPDINTITKRLEQKNCSYSEGAGAHIQILFGGVSAYFGPTKF